MIIASIRKPGLCLFYGGGCLVFLLLLFLIAPRYHIRIHKALWHIYTNSVDANGIAVAISNGPFG